MISKEKFVDIINRLRNYNDMQDEIRDISKKYIEPMESDFNNAAEICVGHETVVVDLLRNIFDDEENDILGWWIWECDYGRSFKKGFLVELDGTKPDLTTPEKLYDYLTENMEV